MYHITQVEDLRKPRGISVDEDQKIQQSDCKRPFLTHQPRSYQVCRHKRTVSEDRNLQLAALGYSPDPLKKQPTFGSISKKTLYKPKNVEVYIKLNCLTYHSVRRICTWSCVCYADMAAVMLLCTWSCVCYADMSAVMLLEASLL